MDDIRETSGIGSETPTDGDFGSDFESGLFDGDLENQQSAGQEAGEGAAEGLENQQPGGQQEKPENQPPDKVNSSAGAREGALGQGGTQQEGQPPAEQQQAKLEPVPMTYNGQQILLPAEAVQALRGALGMDPVALLQKGMNYDQKAERELRILDQFATASGMNRAQYLSQLEQMQKAEELKTEIEKVRGEFPEGTPDAALQEIAKNRIASRHAAIQQQAMQETAAVRQMQQRAQAAVQQAKAKSLEKEWDRYEAETGIHTPDKIPSRVMELVQQGKSPMEAHLIYQNEQTKQELEKIQKQQDNRNRSTGSLAGGADEADEFLSGLFG